MRLRLTNTSKGFNCRAWRTTLSSSLASISAGFVESLVDIRRKPAWKAELKRESSVDVTNLISIRNEVVEVIRAVRFRDFWTIFALLVATAMSVFFNILARDEVERSALLGVIWGLVFLAIVTTVLIWARLSRRSDEWTLRSRLEYEIGRLEKQKWLLDKIHYWFLGPMVFGIVLTVFIRDSQRVPATSLWLYYGVCVVIVSLTYWLCRRESRRKFKPLLERMRELHRDLVTG